MTGLLGRLTAATTAACLMGGLTLPAYADTVQEQYQRMLEMQKGTYAVSSPVPSSALGNAAPVPVQAETTYTPPTYTPNYVQPRPAPAPIVGDSAFNQIYLQALAQQQPYYGGPVAQPQVQPVATTATIPTVEEARAPSDPRIINNPDYWKNYYRAPWAMVTAPGDWGTKEWAIAGGIGAGTIGLMFLDRGIKNGVQSRKNGFLDSLTDAAGHLGEKEVGFLAFPAVYAAGWAFDDPKTQQTGLLGFQAWTLAAIMQTAIKVSFDRERPNKAKDQWEFGGFSLSGDNSSFVSGHATYAFTAASVLSHQYDSLWVSIPAYSVASLVAYQRMYANKHWASDVFAGAALGWAIGKVVTDLAPWNSEQYALIPVISTEEVAMNVTIPF